MYQRKLNSNRKTTVSGIIFSLLIWNVCYDIFAFITYSIPFWVFLIKYPTMHVTKQAFILTFKFRPLTIMKNNQSFKYFELNHYRTSRKLECSAP